MSEAILDNPKAGRVRRAAALARKKDRLQTGRFLVEGPQAVRELLTHRAELTDTVFATLGAEPWQFEVDRLASDHGIALERVTDEVLAALTDTVQPQGVVAVARLEVPPLETVLCDARLVAVLHEVRDPGNAGAVLRAADAAGADAVVFVGAAIDPWHPKVVRSTTGSLFHLPVTTAPDLATVVTAARAAGLQVLAADVRGDELDPDDASLAQPIAWVFGNEAHGLSSEERALTDGARRLPIFGLAESLNLATAASVCLYTSAFAQRR